MFKSPFSGLRRQSHSEEVGFSFLELVIVVAVIGILTAIAIPSYGGIQNAAKQGAVDSAAENGVRLAIAAQQSLGGTNSGGIAKTPGEAIQTLANETIGITFLNAEGVATAEPTGADLCVYAYNKLEKDGDKNKFESFEGKCSSDSPTFPGDSEGPGAGNPGTGSGESANAISMTLNCDSDTTWSYGLNGFSGSQKWSDGSTVAGTSPKELTANRTYTVEFVGNYSGAYASDNASAACIREVNSWNPNSGALSLNYALMNAINVTKVAEPPATVTDISNLFNGASSFNQNINDWDVSNVEYMEFTFANTAIFDQPLDEWDVSGVADMIGLFESARAFNQNIDSWTVSNVTRMDRIFAIATSFNQPLNSWDTSNVTIMTGAFNYAENFNQPLSNWKLDKVTNTASMFQGAEKFNQSLNSWVMSNVTDTQYMFQGALVFNQPLNNWVTSKVTNMQSMFQGARVFNQNIRNWDVSSVTRAQHQQNFRAGSALSSANSPVFPRGV